MIGAWAGWGWLGGGRGERELLSGAYRRSLEVALEHECRSVAFPALSTGAYRYPLAEASRVALGTVLGFLREHGAPELVRFVLFDDVAVDGFRQSLDQLP